MKQFSRNKTFIHPFAQRFFDRVSLTNIEKKAINKLCLDLTNNNLWYKINVLYPFVGGTSISNSYNLIDPNLYRITWNGSITHNSNGVTGDGSTGYGNTGFNPVNALCLTSNFSISVYSRGPTPAGGTTRIDIGVQGVGTSQISQMGWIQSGTIEGGRIGVDTAIDNPNFCPTNNILHTGLQTIITNLSRTTTYYRNGGSISGTMVGSSSFYNGNFFILTLNNIETPSNFSSKNLALVSIGYGRNPVEELLFYKIIENFQSSLGRGGQ